MKTHTTLRLSLPFALSLLFLSCHNQAPAPASSGGKPIEKNYLAKAAKKMTKKQLIAVAGDPTNMEELGSTINENGDTTRTEIWYYGTNQAVTFANDSVAGLDYNVQSSNARIQHTIDSARAAEAK